MGQAVTTLRKKHLRFKLNCVLILKESFMVIYMTPDFIHYFIEKNDIWDVSAKERMDFEDSNCLFIALIAISCAIFQTILEYKFAQRQLFFQLAKNENWYKTSLVIVT